MTRKEALLEIIAIRELGAEGKLSDGKSLEKIDLILSNLDSELN